MHTLVGQVEGMLLCADQHAFLASGLVSVHTFIKVSHRSSKSLRAIDQTVCWHAECDQAGCPLT